MTPGATSFRQEPRSSDPAGVREIVESTGFFRPAEADVAVELVEDRLARGERSGYYFVFADEGGRTIGYACFGPIACTVRSFDLFWIAVRASHQGRGLGRALIARSEAAVAGMGGARIYVETSTLPKYAPTLAFYERCGYRKEAFLEDFYDTGDGKLVYVKVLPSPPPSAAPGR